MCARVFGAAGSQNFGRTYLMLQPKYQRVDKIPTDEAPSPCSPLPKTPGGGTFLFTQDLFHQSPAQEDTGAEDGLLLPEIPAGPHFLQRLVQLSLLRGEGSQQCLLRPDHLPRQLRGEVSLPLPLLPQPMDPVPHGRHAPYSQSSISSGV